MTSFIAYRVTQVMATDNSVTAVLVCTDSHDDSRLTITVDGPAAADFKPNVRDVITVDTRPHRND